MTVLPDYLAPGLRIVFCGTASGVRSATVGHYYAGRGNEFWPLLHSAGLVDERLTPEQDARILEFGIGLTDIAKHIAASSDAGLASHYDVAGFEQKIAFHRPRWVAFHGKTAAGEVARAYGHGRRLRLGEQSWSVARSRVFVVPSASGSNRNPDRLEGRPDRLDWFRELADLAGSISPA